MPPVISGRDQYFWHTRAFFSLSTGEVYMGPPGMSHEDLFKKERLPEVVWAGHRGYYIIPFKALVWWAGQHVNPRTVQNVVAECKRLNLPVEHPVADLQFMFDRIRELPPPGATKKPMSMGNVAMAMARQNKENYRASLYDRYGLRKEDVGGDMTLREELINAIIKVMYG